MQRRVICILTGVWLAAFILMGTNSIPRNQLYYFPLNIYGWLVCQISPFSVEPPEIPSISSSLNNDTPIMAVPPWSHISFSSLVSSGSPNQTLVVCSALDNYIVSHYSQVPRWRNTRRIVVFDGGHHLATLATAPDVVLAPVTRGYAAHTHTRDAMPVTEIKSIINELNAPTRLVTAPRWAVVKCEWGLYGWAERLKPYTNVPKPAGNQIISGSHYAVGHRLALAYIDNKKEARRLQKLFASNSDSYDKVLLAFNFHNFNAGEAGALAREWSKLLVKPVSIVNKPETVFSLYQ